MLFAYNLGVRTVLFDKSEANNFKDTNRGQIHFFNLTYGIMNQVSPLESSAIAIPQILFYVIFEEEDTLFTKLTFETLFILILMYVINHQLNGKDQIIHRLFEADNFRRNEKLLSAINAKQTVPSKPVYSAGESFYKDNLFNLVNKGSILCKVNNK